MKYYLFFMRIAHKLLSYIYRCYFIFCENYYYIVCIFTGGVISLARFFFWSRSCRHNIFTPRGDKDVKFFLLYRSWAKLIPSIEESEISLTLSSPLKVKFSLKLTPKKTVLFLNQVQKNEKFD